MARPEKNTVDYFPHPSRHGKKMAYIRKKYGNDGYATWFTILEQLGDSDRHYLDLSNEVGIMYLETACYVDQRIVLEIIEDLVKLGEFDIELWSKHRVLFCQKFVDSIQDAYLKRSNKPPSKGEILSHFEVSVSVNQVNSTGNTVKDEFPILKGDENTQRKEKKIKEKEIILKGIQEENPAGFSHESEEMNFHIQSAAMIVENFPKSQHTDNHAGGTKKEVKENKPPSQEEFLEYAKQWMLENQKDFTGKRVQIISKYQTWIANNWRDGNNRPIKNWKLTFQNTEPYLKSDYAKFTTSTRQAAREPIPGKPFGSL